MADPKRIKVTPAEEEDIVIVAGIADSEASVEGAPAAAPKREQARPSYDERPEVAPDAAAADEPDVEQPAVDARSKRSRREYRETTLEDLESSGTSGMQKAIIAVAVAAIAAFLVWYLLLR